MQRGGRPWFRANRMACSSVTLRVQLLVREETHKVKLERALAACIFIKFSLMQNIAPADAVLVMPNTSRCVFDTMEPSTVMRNTFSHSQRASLAIKGFFATDGD